jgi:hypothetical protein
LSQIQLAQTYSQSDSRNSTANLQLLCDNSPIEHHRKSLRRSERKLNLPTRLELITWATIRCLKEHVAFRSRIIDKTTMRQMHNPSIGIVTGLSKNEWTIATISQIFSHDFHTFTEVFRKSILDARQDNYVVTPHCLLISDLSTKEVVNAVPPVMPPASATLFVGIPHLKEEERRLFYLSLSFDSRIASSLEGALFLRNINRTLRFPERFDEA